jgi:glycosyltransferase involved in cell wall biosynthesis
MKIAVYTITKNESHFIPRWFDSCKDADELVVLDTGSTDDTVEVARKLGITVYENTFSPWRFDVARNHNLNLIDDDIDFCIALDADEILITGWRDALESINPATTRPRYKYVWSWKEDGGEGLVYGGDKIHSRHDYEWKHPVHEVLTFSPRGGGEKEVQEWIDLEIHHHPDPTKSRSQYLYLLKLAVEEDPDDDRNAHYYARDLMFAGRYEEAAEEFKRHLSLPRAVWKAERSASMLYLAEAEPWNKETWLLAAHEEDPIRREPMVKLAMHYFAGGSWDSAITWAEKAVEITDKPLDYLAKEYAWGSVPYDILAVSYYKKGRGDEARKYGTLALLQEPTNQRLLGNLRFYAEI